MPKRTIYITPDGQSLQTLPTIWNNTSPITPETIQHLGWTVTEEEYTPEPQTVAPPSAIDTELRQREQAFVAMLVSYATELNLEIASLDITVAGLTNAAQSAGATDTRILQMQTSLLSLSFDIAACSDHGWKQTWQDFKQRIPLYLADLNQ